jgi:protein-disulfide isomerase
MAQGDSGRGIPIIPLASAGTARLPAATRALSNRQLAQADDPAVVIATRHAEIYNDPDTPVGGNPAGDVAIVEFFDYNCPYCRKVAGVLGELERTDANLRFVYKEFPILGPDSDFAARAALAAHRQGKYLEFHKALMTSRVVANQTTVLQIAETAGLDVERLQSDMDDPALASIVARNLALALALRIHSTPSFVIADRVYAGGGELADFQRVIDAARQSLAQ